MPRRLRLVRRDGDLLPDDRIGQRALTGVGPTDEAREPGAINAVPRRSNCGFPMLVDAPTRADARDNGRRLALDRLRDLVPLDAAPPGVLSGPGAGGPRVRTALPQPLLVPGPAAIRQRLTISPDPLRPLITTSRSLLESLIPIGDRPRSPVTPSDDVALFRRTRHS
ncbi:hypothetical protein M1L60_45625 [Actinoplanes sp. TRM 88003]|uniref:Uncharacterized protein n=1 Tax=Paractinoplanes aksuensis TaxID=2939490 RepID=A0ABT1E414_9ACTN|nr:hypothetical protein [Actinoplanes aksuensis]MCO8277876.1 hypothetical protein [Actinoplanes aksuensis]